MNRFIAVFTKIRHPNAAAIDHTACSWKFRGVILAFAVVVGFGVPGTVDCAFAQETTAEIDERKAKVRAMAEARAWQKRTAIIAAKTRARSKAIIKADLHWDSVITARRARLSQFN